MGKINIFYINLKSILRGLFIGRSSNVVLFGAWMGVKFADNSRYLYQYLHANKAKYGIKEVIWATRNSEVYDMLTKNGYTACIIGTKQSEYYHLRAGVHILCNAAFPVAGFEPDIDTRFSYGAKKVQLWHGVGIKSIGYSSNDAKRNSTKLSLLKRISKWPILNMFRTIGGWDRAKVLATSIKNAEVMRSYLNCQENNIFITGYPRNCQCLELFDEEQKIISHLKKFSQVILYLPTFRSDTSKYQSPLENRKLVEYINQNNILWVEKPHTADVYYVKPTYETNNILSLDSNFDINVIYPYVSTIISDYSSVVFDGIIRNIPVVMYVPDLEEFKMGDVGFIFDVEQYCQGLLAFDLMELKDLVEEALTGNYINEKRKQVYENVYHDYFNSALPSYHQIWESIIKA